MFWKTRAFERYAPALLASLTLATLIYFRSSISGEFTPHGWQSSNLYSAVFNWASIQSGFVFGIYGFVVTKRDGFAGEVAKAEASFNQFLTYARRAYLTGFALTFVSLPIMVINPRIAGSSTTEFWIVAIWFAAFVWTFCAFLRVAFIFGIISATPDKPPEVMG